MCKLNIKEEENNNKKFATDIWKGNINLQDQDLEDGGLHPQNWPP
jgi:hypothetical protein